MLEMSTERMLKLFFLTCCFRLVAVLVILPARHASSHYGMRLNPVLFNLAQPPSSINETDEIARGVSVFFKNNHLKTVKKKK